MKIADYLDSRLIAFLDVETRDEAINVLIDLLNQAGKLPDREAFRQAIFHREEIVSTGIGMGVAFPHAKIADLDDFFVAVGLLEKGIDWNALDGAPVRITTPHIPLPASDLLEDLALPSVERIAATVRKSLES